MKDWVTLEDIYMLHPYKKRDIEGNKVWQPYVKKNQESDHKYALTYREYLKIIECYFEIAVEEMLKGKHFVFPNQLGELRLLRSDKKRKTKRGTLYRNLHTFGFYPMVAWFRHKEADFKRKRWYKFNFSRKIVWKRISQALFKDPSIIYNFEYNSKHE